MGSEPRILIVGGGCGGMDTALRLERLLRPGEATVMVADPRSYMTYQPPEFSHREMRWVLVEAADRIRLDDGEEFDAGTLVWTAGPPRSATAPPSRTWTLATQPCAPRPPSFPAWITHRTYHLLKLPTMNRRLRVVSDWTLVLLFRREVVSLDVLGHPRQDFQAALRVIATGSPRATPFPGQEEKEDGPSCLPAVSNKNSARSRRNCGAPTAGSRGG